MSMTRRTFLCTASAAVAAASVVGNAAADKPADPVAKPIQGFEKSAANAPAADASRGYQPVSDKKVRVGLVGYGVCKFAAAFGFQDHPNVDVVAVSDLIPDRCDGLAKAAHCAKTYPSLEELVKDDKVEAVFVATDAPNHAKHVIECLEHGKHVASAVPACFASVEEGARLFEAAKKAKGLKYMMFETSHYHADLHAMRTLYDAGAFGKVVYSEGEYYHYMEQPIDSYKGWRVGLPPQFYPTHSNAYYVGVTAGHFTEVSCMGIPSKLEHLQAGNNAYKNPFGTEVALFRTGEGGASRMAVSWDTPGVSGEMGRVRGQKGSFYGQFQNEGVSRDMLPDTNRPPLPPGLDPGGHGGSHGYLTHEFITAILQNRKPLVDITQALNMTLAGIIAHQSAMRDGELLKIPRYRLA